MITKHQFSSCWRISHYSICENIARNSSHIIGLQCYCRQNIKLHWLFCKCNHIECLFVDFYALFNIFFDSILKRSNNVPVDVGKKKLVLLNSRTVLNRFLKDDEMRLLWQKKINKDGINFDSGINCFLFTSIYYIFKYNMQCFFINF